VKGIYIVANDEVIDNTIALLNSIRSYDKEVSIMMIPYDENYQRVYKVAKQYGVELYPYSSVKRFLNDLENIFDSNFFLHPNKLVKLLCFFGPFDEFLYLDTDIIVFEKIVNILDNLKHHDFISCDHQRDKFNSGFWASKKLFSKESMYEVLTECALHPEKFDLSVCSDQPIINFLVKTRMEHIINLSEAGSWAGSTHFVKKGRKLLDPNVKKPLKYLHWAGISIKPKCPYYSIWEQYRFPNFKKPFVSVIIPALDVPLEKCLQALEHQTYSKYEVIVVNNSTNLEVKRIVSKFPGVIYTTEPVLGCNVARNRGILLAKGDVFAFTDADCIPKPDWIEKGVKNLLSIRNCGLVAGRIDMTSRGRPNIIEKYEQVWGFKQKKYISKWNFGATANIFTFRDVISKVGMLDPSLTISADDLEWGNRVHEAGYAQLYADDVCVSHPARYSLKQLTGKMKRVIRGLNFLRNKVPYTWRSFLTDLRYDWPRFEDFSSIFGKLSLFDTIGVLVLMLYVKFIRSTELIRLRL